MSDDNPLMDQDDEEPNGKSGAPERPRLPVISLAISAVFLVLGGLLLYFVRGEIAYFFVSRSPDVRLEPTRGAAVPPDAPSNVYAQARIDPTALCDHWDAEINPLPPEETRAFTLRMGMGNRYYLTCVDGDARPRLWILRPESTEETAAIEREARMDLLRSRPGSSFVSLGEDGRLAERLPERHIPGGPGCVNDYCRGRLIRFSDYAQNPLGGVRRIQDVLRDRLQAEYRRTGRLPLEDADYLFILGEDPGTRWWYAALLAGILLLTTINIFLGIRSLRRFLEARRIVAEYLRQVGADAARKGGRT